MARSNLAPITLDLKGLMSKKGWTDLVVKLGDRERALGAIGWAYVVAQRFWFPDKQRIPREAWLEEGLNDAIISCGLATENADGIYLRGSDDYFKWLFDQQDKGRKSGEARRARAAERASGAHLNRGQPRPTEANRVEPNPTDSNLLLPSSSSFLVEVVEGAADASAVEKPVKKVPPTDLFKPASAAELLAGMSEAKRAAWAELYPDEEYRNRQVLKAFSYYRDDRPKDLPTSRGGWARALNHWLETGWARHLAERRAAERIGTGSPRAASATSSNRWDELAGRLMAAVRKHPAGDTAIATTVGDDWAWVSKSGLMSMVRALEPNDHGRRRLAKDLREAFQQHESTIGRSTG